MTVSSLSRPAIRRALPTLVFALAAAWALGACGDGEGCDVPLKDCDTESCSILVATRLSPDGAIETSQPAGCTPKSYGAPDQETFARDAEGNCWSLPQSYLPYGLEADDACRQRFYAAETLD